MVNRYYQHLTPKIWSKLPLSVQLANVGSEVERTISWKVKGQAEYSQTAFFRALELLDLSLKAARAAPRLKELTRLRETLVDYFFGENLMRSSDKLWHTYFYAFSYAASLRRRR